MAFQFKLLEGRHVDADPDDPKVDKLYKPGAVFTTEVDLRKLNGLGMTPKFEFLGEAPSPASVKGTKPSPGPNRRA